MFKERDSSCELRRSDARPERFVLQLQQLAIKLVAFRACNREGSSAPTLIHNDRKSVHEAENAFGRDALIMKPGVDGF